jgi:hypothetical protein
MRLVKEAAVFEIGHDVADRRGAQGLFIPLGNRARRHRLAGLDVRPHEIRENLTVSPFL